VEEERTKCKKFKLQLIALLMCVSVKGTNAWCAFGCSSKGLIVDCGKVE
jgi:hypothetical protein